MSQKDDGPSLPPRLKGIDEGSFAHHTIVNRWPRIAQLRVCTLRTLNSEVMSGLTFEQVEWLRETDPDGLIDGDWG